MTKDSRYPFTYACDFVRNVVGFGDTGMKLNRAEASRILSEIARITGADHKEFAAKIADEYLHAEQTSITEEVKHFMGNLLHNSH